MVVREEGLLLERSHHYPGCCTAFPMTSRPVPPSHPRLPTRATESSSPICARLRCDPVPDAPCRAFRGTALAVDVVDLLDALGLPDAVLAGFDAIAIHTLICRLDPDSVN